MKNNNLPTNLLDATVSQNDVIDMMVQDKIDVLTQEYDTLKNQLEEFRKTKPVVKDVTDMVKDHVLSVNGANIKKLLKVCDKGVKPHVVLHYWNGNVTNKVSSELGEEIMVVFTKKGNEPNSSMYNVGMCVLASVASLKVDKVSWTDIKELKEYNEAMTVYKKEDDALCVEVQMLRDEIQNVRNDKNKFKAKLTRSILEGSEEGKKLISSIESLMSGTRTLQEKN
jgi:prefoldin subunit 5